MTAALSLQHSLDSASLSANRSIQSVRDCEFITDCQMVQNDTVDIPVFKKFINGHQEQSILGKMKYECNRLLSFHNKWPISEIKPESLAAAGFFYLQHEDKVQCPFCCEIISDWTYGDKPLRRHMKKSPKCPFLLGSDVGNIPLSAGSQNKPLLMNPVHERPGAQSASAIYKPKYPRMADIKRRILTYSDWLLDVPSPQDLAECGLYYSGVNDVVICFFCGGSLGNWEMHDNPWEEHSKFFPDCAYLSLAKSRHMQPKVAGICRIESKQKPGLLKFNPMNGIQKSNPVGKIQCARPVRSDCLSEIIEQAFNIFPKSLVLEAVNRKGGNIHSLQELCDNILELEKPKSATKSSNNSSKISSDIEIQENSSAVNSDALLCKICMDRERGVVFQPCGHLVACQKCSQLIADCPVCRRPIVNIIKTYFS